MSDRPREPWAWLEITSSTDWPTPRWALMPASLASPLDRVIPAEPPIVTPGATPPRCREARS